MDSFTSEQGDSLPVRIPGVVNLTWREWAVLLLLADEVTVNADIADRLHMQKKSPRTYRTRIAGKLDMKGRCNLNKFAKAYRAELHYWYRIFYPPPPPQ